ncbi:hypothetical protein [Mesobacillus jeotgali]|nr:hypothetical protein [Mesobacillus jeotgali]
MLVEGIKVAVDPSIEYEAKSTIIDFINNEFILTRNSMDFC